MDKAKVKRIAVSTIAAATIMIGASAANAQDARLKSIVDEVNRSNEIAQASQQKIDGIANETSKLLVEYKGVLKTNAGLRAYNAQQRRVISRQEEEIEKIKVSIGQIDEIKRQITPLMLEMIDNLAEFISQDIPFQTEEREDRIDSLKDVMDDPNVSDPERFRLVLEAYKAEVQYGRTINAYEASLEDGRSVNFVRMGRVGFYYQTKDGNETAAWNTETGAWERLGQEYNAPVKQLLKIARRQAQQDIVVIPIAAPAE
ncbi:DUF3450 domain-containing protein [Kordiimonas sediminis]|uniref:DUF3450 domain-containing protein n=1 Tax=Kordiimonas sediminis TaxID=1735581 RepID=A0A919E665_9PROT|nr:DUF3450 domain-containing protein [Kordiimonas sediminis]GHF16925.1 DUF3450 domain-containing protein [Kordiimonas sediminis]